MNKTRLRKIGNIITNVLLYVFLAICIFAVFFTLFSKKAPDGAADIFGYQMRVVASDSMAKNENTDVSDYEIKHIPVRSMIFIKTVPEDIGEAEEWYRALKVGDVLTFRYVYTTQVTITHRIVSISEKDTGGFIIELSGDNKRSEDGQLTQTIDTSVADSSNYIIGKVTGSSYLLGVIMSLLMKPLGIVLVVILPCLMIILLEALKIAGVLSERKKSSVDAELARKESEIDELRRRLAELEDKNASEDTQDICDNEND